MEEAVEARLVAGHHRFVGVGQRRGEVEAEHPADRLCGEGDARRTRALHEAVDQRARVVARATRRIPAPRSARAWRVPPPPRPDCRTACPPGTPGPSGAIFSMMSRRPPNAPTGMPPPITLPSVVRSGVMPIQRLRAAACTRKPVITSSKISTLPWRSHSARRPSRKPGARRDQVHVAGDRLDDDAGDRVALRRERGLDRVEIVVRQRRSSRWRSPAARRPTTAAERQRARARLHEQAVAVAVIAAFELDDLRAARCSRARGAARSWSLRCPTTPAARAPSTARSRHERLGHLDLELGRRAERQPVRRAPPAPPRTTSGCAWPTMAGPHEPT